MPVAQPGILSELQPHARYMLLQLKPAVSQTDLSYALRQLQARADGDAVVVGFGSSLFSALGTNMPGLSIGPDLAQSLVPLAVKETALWCWLRGTDRGDLLRLEHALMTDLGHCFELSNSIDAFVYKEGRDLTGYEDGTENPEGDEAIATALISTQQAETISQQTGKTITAYENGSYVAVQQWLHNFKAFDAMDQQTKDHTIGRRLSDNEELEDAPISAHVKRTEQEGFSPEAFILRRSMPWTAGARAGLVFVAFGHSFRAFEVMLARMTGIDDGIIDSLFTISKPVSSSYCWCPPLQDGRISLDALGL